MGQVSFIIGFFSNIIRFIALQSKLCSITKEERRRQFALRVAQQDEELRARRCQEDVWRRHLEHCLSVGLEPSV